MLLDSRWLIGGMSKDSRVRASHTWANIMTIDAGKQFLFVNRVIWLHELARRRGGKGSAVRLTPAEFNQALDKMALAAHVLDFMDSQVDDDGNRLFVSAQMAALKDRLVEGSLN